MYLTPPLRYFGAIGRTAPIAAIKTLILGSQTLADSAGIATLNHALESGLTYFETTVADLSLRHLKQAASGKLCSLVVGATLPPAGAGSVKKQICGVLERLGAPILDIAHLEIPNEGWSAAIAAGDLEELQSAKDEGLIRAVGIAFKARPEAAAADLRRIERACGRITEFVDVIQVPLGFADINIGRSAETLLPMALSVDASIIATKTLGGGFHPRDWALCDALARPDVSAAVVVVDSVASVDHLLGVLAGAPSRFDLRSATAARSLRRQRHRRKESASGAAGAVSMPMLVMEPAISRR